MTLRQKLNLLGLCFLTCLFHIGFILFVQMLVGFDVEVMKVVKITAAFYLLLPFAGYIVVIGIFDEIRS